VAAGERKQDKTVRRASNIRAWGSCVLAIRLAKFARRHRVHWRRNWQRIDYWTNFAFVKEVLDMDDVPPRLIRWRAVTSPVLHHAGYILIIATEIATAALCALGAIVARRFRSRRSRAPKQVVAAARVPAV
jgi:predicted small integral membrane protein